MSYGYVCNYKSLDMIVLSVVDSSQFYEHSLLKPE